MNTLYLDRLAACSALDAVACTIAIGAHLVSERDGYVHHGIYVGNGQVIHYGGFDRAAARRPVEYISLRCFAADVGVSVQSEPNAVYGAREVVERAKSRLGEDRYRLLTNNCEHFCAWCVSGVARSEQVCRCLRNPWTGFKTMLALFRGQFTGFSQAQQAFAGVARVAAFLF